MVSPNQKLVIASLPECGFSYMKAYGKIFTTSKHTKALAFNVLTNNPDVRKAIVEFLDSYVPVTSLDKIRIERLHNYVMEKELRSYAI